MRHLTLALLLALGCSTSFDDGGPEVDLGYDSKDDGIARPLGSFDAPFAQAGDPVRLVLMSDRRFHLERAIVCITTPCDPVVSEGTYKFTSSGSRRYVKLLAEDGTLVVKYAWVLEGDTLELREVYTSDWIALERSPAGYCAEPSDCELQGLVHPMCEGGWTCEANACGWQCEAPATTACEAAGGSCVGLAPGACEGGVTLGDADHSCGDTVGVTCCMPAAACVPVCDAIGSRSEGWYDGCTGELLCWAPCAGAEATCGAIGSRSEGWYAPEGVMGCLGGGSLIGWTDCAP